MININKRKRRLLKIKAVRKIRDELLTCSNAGRGVYLLKQLPTVCNVDAIRVGDTVKRLKIKTYDYYEYEYWNKQAFIELSKIAYRKWLSIVL